MGISRYLAITKAEMATFSLPEGYWPGWMACHFSAYGTGLSNFPRKLPSGSMVILNDRTPICGHDHHRIRQQLEQILEENHCSCVLLDFQRPGEPQTQALCEHLAKHLPCPLGVSDLYGEGLPCPVFLAPVPLDQSLDRHLAPWEGREIWLDMAVDAGEFTVTETGSSFQALQPIHQEDGFFDEGLCCSYKSSIFPDRIQFTLWRDISALEALAAKAEAMGVTKLLGLFQQWESQSKKAPCQHDRVLLSKQDEGLN